MEKTRWLTEKQVAAKINCSLSKLRQDRHKCIGIPYCKFGRSVRYALKDVAKYLEQHRVLPIYYNTNRREENGHE